MGEVNFTENPFWWLALNIVAPPIVFPIMLGAITVHQISEKIDARSKKIRLKKNYQSLPSECKEIVDISGKI